MFLVPPKISVLLDEKGSEVADIVGPYNVGGTLILTCDILGGKHLNLLDNFYWFMWSSVSEKCETDGVNWIYNLKLKRKNKETLQLKFKLMSEPR